MTNKQTNKQTNKHNGFYYIDCHLWRSDYLPIKSWHNQNLFFACCCLKMSTDCFGLWRLDTAKDLKECRLAMWLLRDLEKWTLEVRGRSSSSSSCAILATSLMWRHRVMSCHMTSFEERSGTRWTSCLSRCLTTGPSCLSRPFFRGRHVTWPDVNEF